MEIINDYDLDILIREKEMQIAELDKKRRELRYHKEDAYYIQLDPARAKDKEWSEAEANYCIGQAEGFYMGYVDAIDAIIEELAPEGQRGAVTEDMLHIMVVLGEKKERAWLKHSKNQEILSNFGWDSEFSDKNRHWVWKKKDNKEIPKVGKDDDE